MLEFVSKKFDTIKKFKHVLSLVKQISLPNLNKLDQVFVHSVRVRDLLKLLKVLVKLNCCKMNIS